VFKILYSCLVLKKIIKLIHDAISGAVKLQLYSKRPDFPTAPNLPYRLKLKKDFQFRNNFAAHAKLNHPTESKIP